MKHVKCSVFEREKERPLCRIATRGVVKFFNVIQQQKFDLQNKLNSVAPYERKKDQVYKSIDEGSFLDRLKEQSYEEDAENKKIEQAKIDTKEPTWSVLRDDFVMNGKMENWDKEDRDEENNEGSEDSSDDKKVSTKPNNKTKLNQKSNKRSKRLRK